MFYASKLKVKRGEIMKIKLRDEEREYKKGVSVLDIASSISEGLARTAVCGKVNGKLVDLSYKLEDDAEVQILTSKDAEAKMVMRHTTAHVLAQAVKSIYPNAKLSIGPATNDGFYYDFEFKTPINNDDLAKIEAEMKKIIKANFEIKREVVSKEKALKWAKEEKEPYKIELVNAVPDGEEISLYTQGDFTDVCRGPHLRSTGVIKAFKLTKLAGAYWRGDEKNKMLTRIYGVVFDKASEMDAYFKMVEEAEKRDHRKLGPQLDLFMFHETAPGMPYWLPKGWKMFNILLNFWREVHEENGYLEISAPIINNVSLWKTSGHWDHYREDMFKVAPENAKGEIENAIKPMNCPNAMLIFKNKVRSYRDLPLRISDCDILHRDEKSGTLHGLLRVRSFRQDDSHNFIRFDQIKSEFTHLFDLADSFYKIFGIKYVPMLSTRPDDYLGEKAVWDEAESVLRGILDERYGKGNYQVDEGGGAFYGPKIDLKMFDALGREWQTGTFQLDMQLPARFNLTYTDKDGSRKTPIVVHRVIYGSLERFIGILIENFAGAFPFWFSPLQVGIVPVNEKHNEYAQSVRLALKKAKIRAEVDESDSGMGQKVRGYQTQKVPYTLVVGDKEMESGCVAVRNRDGKQLGTVKLEKFIEVCQKLNDEKTLELAEKF